MRNPLKIKVCGMRIPENLEKVCALRPDYVGYIFYPGSKRYVGNKPDPALFRLPPPSISKVGVFVNEHISRIKELQKEHSLDMVQLHGSESATTCKELMDAGIQVIKALKPDSSWEEYVDVVPFFLFDTPDPGWGGTGKKFDWNLITLRSIPRPFLLSGGIGPEDAGVVREVNHENFRGIDINSRFESAPGEKDIQRLKGFITEIRK